MLVILAVSFSAVADEKKEIIKPPKKGFVTLTKEEYKKLLERLKPAEDISVKAPREWVVKTADYLLKIDDEGRVKGTVSYEVESLTDEKWVEARLQSNSKGISMYTPPEGVLLKNKGNSIYFGTNLTKSFLLTGEINGELEKQDLNSFAYRLTASDAVINRVKIEWNGDELELKSSPLIKISESGRGKISTLSGLAQQGRYLTFSFDSRKVEEVTDTRERRVETEVNSTFTVEKGILRVSYHLGYKTNRDGFANLKIALPAGFNVISVNGDNLKTWEDSSSGDRTVIDVEVESKNELRQNIYITGDIPLGREQSVVALPLALPVNVYRVKGTAAVSSSDEIEVLTGDVYNAQEIDISDLPDRFSAMTGFKAVLAYRFWQEKDDSPPAVSLNMRQFEKVAVLAANIENAHITTLLTGKGTKLLKAVYWIRNNIKQNLKVTPPAGYELWSCFADDEPVKPMLDTGDDLLVPLKKSRNVNDSVLTKIEMVFYHKGSGLAEEGTLTLEAPSVDLQVMKFAWELLLPRKMEIDKWISPYQQASLNKFNTYVSPERKQVAQKKWDMRQQNIASNQFYAQQARQQEIAQQNTVLIQNFQKRGVLKKVSGGRLPVKFEMPRSGRQYLFYKILVIGATPAIRAEYEIED